MATAEKKMKIRASAIPVVLFFIIITNSVAQKIRNPSEGKTLIQNANTPRIINNSNDPIYKNGVITFENDLTIGGSEESPEYTLGMIISIETDDQGNIYICDIKFGTVKVYDSHGKYLRSIGRRGQGPGEFQIPTGLQWTSKNSLLVYDPAKSALIFFSRDGRLINEIINPYLNFGYQAYSDTEQNYYILKFRSFIDLDRRVEKFNNSFVSLYSMGYLPKSLKPASAPTHPSVEIRFVLFGGNQIIWGINDSYEINFANNRGKIYKKIIKKYLALRINDEYKKSFLQNVPKGYPSRTEFRSHFPAFDLFAVDEEGWLYVKTYEVEQVTGKSIMDVFSPDGRFFTRVALKFPSEPSTYYSRFVVRNNFIYLQDENDNGDPVVKRYKIIKRMAKVNE
jgi:hypothetical protein